MLNRCDFIGRVGHPPEVKYSPAGIAVANFSLAITEKWRDKDKGRREKTEWVRIVAFNKLAEIIGQYVSKGSLLFISGKLQTRTWEDKNGNKRYTTEIVAREMQMLEKKGDRQEETQEKDYGGYGNEGDDAVPF